MNLVFLLIALCSVYLLAANDPDAVMTTMLSGATSGLTLVFKLFAIYAVWLSVLKIFSDAGIDKALAQRLRKITRFLFKDENENAYTALTINLSANMLGMGGASTPMGIKAIEEMKHHKNKVMLIVINSTSIQLIPTTVIALRATYGSTMDIILPSLIATACTSAIGIILVKALVK